MQSLIVSPPAPVTAEIPLPSFLRTVQLLTVQSEEMAIPFHRLLKTEEAVMVAPKPMLIPTCWFESDVQPMIVLPLPAVMPLAAFDCAVQPLSVAHSPVANPLPEFDRAVQLRNEEPWSTWKPSPLEFAAQSAMVLPFPVPMPKNGFPTAVQPVIMAP